MKKVKKSEQKILGDQKPKWKKITRGTLYPFPNKRNKKVKPHETISATTEELGKYIDQFELVKEGTGKFKVSKTSSNSEKTSVSRKSPKFSLSPVEVESAKEGEKFFNILSPSGKIVNDKPLTEEEAEELKNSLEKK